VNRLALILKSWLPLATTVTLVYIAIYAVVQQTYRTSADDPQVQIARDVAQQLAGGAAIETVVPIQTVDISRSLKPFVMVFDRQNQLVATNARLNGQNPAVPSGVIDTARQKGENRVSWQPAHAVRAAVVAVAVPGSDGSVVLSGRSLQEVEEREASLSASLAAGWCVTLLATIVVVAFLEFLPFTRSRA